MAFETDGDKIMGGVALLLIVAVLASLAVTFWPIALALVVFVIWFIVRKRRVRSSRREAAFAGMTAALVELRDDVEFPLIIASMTALSSGEAPTYAMLERGLQTNSSTAHRAMELLEQLGVVNPAIGSRRRTLGLPPHDFTELVKRVEAAINHGPAR